MSTLLNTQPNSVSSDSRRGMASPRPKGRENLKNTHCRNIGIFGFCKYEKDGCAYNHDPPSKTTKAPSTSTASSESGATGSRFNVDSPSFTPLQNNAVPATNGLRASAISPRSANAAPFTPKSSDSPLSSHARPNMNPSLTNMPSLWADSSIAEFVPQGYESAHAVQADGQNSSAMAPGLDNYALHSALQSLTTTPQPQMSNPYLQDPNSLNAASYFQNANSFAQPLQHHLYMPLAPHRENLLTFQRTTHDFFIPEDLRREFQRRNEAALQVLPNGAVLPTVDHFHSLVPLDTQTQKHNTIFGYGSWLYKAINSKDGQMYALRRIEGYRLTNEMAIRCLQPWKRLNCASITTIHDVFTTRNFGDSSLIFVTDYHPSSTTLAEHHLTTSLVGRSGDRYPIRNQNPQHVPESTLWSYMVQIASALKTIHSNGLAAQMIHPTKVLLTSKNRIRLNACGIFDVIKYDPAQGGLQRAFKGEQQDDFSQLGRLILSIAVGNIAAYSHPQKYFDGLARGYTNHLRECLSWLITNSNPDQPKSVDILLSEISSNLTTVLDNTYHAIDTMESTLATSLEDGRMARLMFKLNIILERSDQESNRAWSESGERYMLKLFRDYVFHSVDHNGRPNTDLGHIVGCLNRLDAGSTEAIQLASRDGDTMFIVSYKELKRGFENAWNELSAAGSSGAIGKGRNMK